MQGGRASLTRFGQEQEANHLNVYSKTILTLNYLLAPAGMIGRVIGVHLVGVIVVRSSICRAVGVQLVGVIVRVALSGVTLWHVLVVEAQISIPFINKN